MQSLWGTVFISSLTVCEAIQETQEDYILMRVALYTLTIVPEVKAGLNYTFGYSVHKWLHFSLVIDTESANHNRRITTIDITSGHCTPGSSATNL